MAMERPTLHEIAAMPFPQSVKALRQHYDKNWGRFENGEPRTYTVTVRYTEMISGTEIYEIEASSEAEAEALAGERFDKDHPFGDIDIDDIEVEAADD